MNSRFRGTISGRKMATIVGTNLLQIIIFGLQRAAGPYRWAMNDILHRRRITSLFAVGPRSTVAVVSAGGKKGRDAARHVKPDLRA